MTGSLGGFGSHGFVDGFGSLIVEAAKLLEHRRGAVEEVTRPNFDDVEDLHAGVSVSDSARDRLDRRAALAPRPRINPTLDSGAVERPSCIS